MLSNLGISTSYFAAKGFSIYDAVVEADKLGFHLIELGANHNFEDNIWTTIKRIRHDFPDIIFTQHCYFPPIYKREFFSNSAEGLTIKNKQVLDMIFEAAKILNSQVISFHSGLNTKFIFKGHFREFAGFKEFKPTETISPKQALVGLREFVDYALKKADDLSIKVAMENIVGGPEYATTLTGFNDFQAFFKDHPQLNFLFDFGHGWIVHKENAYRFFDFGQKIIEMHLDDVTPEMHDHRVLGKGILDLERLFGEINKLRRLRHPEFISGSMMLKQVQHDGLPLPLLILEHSAEVKEEEIKKEVELIEEKLD